MPGIQSFYFSSPDVSQALPKLFLCLGLAASLECKIVRGSKVLLEVTNRKLFKIQLGLAGEVGPISKVGGNHCRETSGRQ